MKKNIIIILIALLLFIINFGTISVCEYYNVLDEMEKFNTINYELDKMIWKNYYFMKDIIDYEKLSKTEILSDEFFQYNINNDVYSCL